MGRLKTGVWHNDRRNPIWQFVFARGISILISLSILLLAAYVLRPRSLDQLYHVTVRFNNLTEQDGDLLLTAYDYKNPFIIEDYAKRVSDLDGLKERAYFRVPLEVYTIMDPAQIKDDREMLGQIYCINGTDGMTFLPLENTNAQLAVWQAAALWSAVGICMLWVLYMVGCIYIWRRVEKFPRLAQRLPKIWRQAE